MDLRYAVRVLFRSPGFFAIAVLTLALGIGINTVVFTLYSAVALKPIAARRPAELVRISGSQNGQSLSLFSYSQFDQIRLQSHSFSEVIATSDPQILTGRLPRAQAGQPELLHARLVSNNYFSALGVTPESGRGFLPDDREVAVISHAFWTNKLDADPEVLTKTVQVRGAALHIVGVAPERFAGTGVPPQMPDLWIPSAMQTQVLPGVDWLHDDAAKEWQVLARRLPAMPVAQASADLEVLARSWPLVEGKPAHLAAQPATFFQTDQGEFEVFGWVCGILMVAVGLILLIGSINLVNLLFARHAAREREFAVRRALGAGRLHLVRQLCTESLLLGAAGGMVGLLLSLWASEWIGVEISSLADRLTGGLVGIFLDISPDWHVFAFTAAISVFTGVAVGLWPAIKASLPDVGLALKQSSGSAGGRHKRGFLIGAQVAACLILLAGAGLLFQGVWRSSTIDTGFDLRHVLVVGINSQAVTTSASGQTELMRHVTDRVGAIPGVASVAWADRAPFLGHGTAGFENERGADIACLYNLVSEGYFETLGIPLVAGRTFTRQEVENHGPVVVINDVAARQAWPGQDPIGHRVSGVGWLKRDVTPHESYTVIGVVKGVRSTFLSKPDQAYVYFAKPLSAGRGFAILARTQGTPEGAAHVIFSGLGAIDPNLPAQTVLVALDKAPSQIQRMMAEAPAVTAFMLGVVALLLASLGVFGVVSQLVAQRTREIAIRASLGAQNRDVIRMVIGQTLRPVLVGALAGLAGALAISALLAKMVVTPDMPDLTYGSGAFDPITFSGVLAVLMLVILVASFAPVRRATRIAPADALRNE